MTDAVIRRAAGAALAQTLAPSYARVPALPRSGPAMQRAGGVIGDALEPCRPTEEVVFINGINTTQQAFVQALDAIAHAARGPRVMGVYNGTDGPAGDWKQGYLDHIYPEANKAIVSMATLAVQIAEQHKPLVIVAHSQGAALAAQGLRIAKERLLERYAPEQVARLLATLRVETHGAAGCSFVDGPKYVHYVNTADPVPHVMGFAGWLSLSTLHHAGRGAVFRYFTDVRAHHPQSYTTVMQRIFSRYEDTVHSMSIYADHRVPFDEAYSAGSNSGGSAETQARWWWAPPRFIMDVLSLPLTIMSAMTGRRDRAPVAQTPKRRASPALLPQR